MMTDPAGELAKVRRLLKPPGELIGEAPNSDATEWHLSGALLVGTLPIPIMLVPFGKSGFLDFVATP